MKDRIDMTITLPDLTQAQAIALHAMFQYWALMGSWGCSRMVGFYVDGDGNFRIKPRIEFSSDIYRDMTEDQKQELWATAHISRVGPNEMERNPQFDFDPVAWKMNDD